MRKLILSMTVLLGWLVASMAHAVTISINGVSYDVTSFTISQTTGKAVITTDPAINVGSGGSSGGDNSGGDNSGGDNSGGDNSGGDNSGGNQSSCVENSTLMCGSINWASPGGRLTGAVPNTSVVQAWQFTTTGNPLYAGSVNVAETTGHEGVTRRLWISTSPGGPALANSRCSSEGNSNRKLSWGQSAMFLRCPLATNTTYFLNLQNVQGCSATASCGFYRNTVTNLKP